MCRKKSLILSLFFILTKLVAGQVTTAYNIAGMNMPYYIAIDKGQNSTNSPFIYTLGLVGFVGKYNPPFNNNFFININRINNAVRLLIRQDSRKAFVTNEQSAGTSYIRQIDLATGALDRDYQLAHIPTDIIENDVTQGEIIFCKGNGRIGKITNTGVLNQNWVNLGALVANISLRINNGVIYVLSRDYTNGSTNAPFIISLINPDGSFIKALATVSNIDASIALGNNKGFEVDAIGNVYVVRRDLKTITKITPDGIVTHNWVRLVNEPTDITIDQSTGNLYVSSLSSNIAKITPDGTVNNTWATINNSGQSNQVEFHSGTVYSRNTNNSVSVITESTPSGTITTSGTVTAVDTRYGRNSPVPSSFMVNGTGLTGPITATAPAGFELSYMNSQGPYSSSISIPHTNGSVSSAVVWVRLSSTATVAGSPYSGNVVLSAANATSQNVPIPSSVVTRAELIIRMNNQSKCQGTTFSFPNNAYTVSGLLNGDVVTANSVTATSAGTVSSAPADTYLITGSGATGTGLSNYNINYAIGVLTVNPLPSFNYPSATYNLTVGVPVSGIIPLVAPSSNIALYIASQFPPGLSFNSTTGEISGTPQIPVNPSPYNIVAHSVAGCTNQVTLNIAISLLPPSNLVYSPNRQTVRPNIAITNMTPNVGGGQVASYGISPRLPDGLRINSSTGTISGTLRDPQTGSVTYTVTASNMGGSTNAQVTLIYNTTPSDVSLSPSTEDENQPIGSDIGVLTATDVDAGDTHTFMLVPGIGSTDNASFTITGNTLKTAAIFDFETKSSYSIRVRATDAGGLTFEKQISISITDVNEAPSDLSISNNSISENAASGTTVGSLSATDVDAGDIFTYTLVSGTGSTDNASFTISGNSLRTSEVFDFETKSSYSIRVRVTDAGGLTFEKQISISITDVNEAPTLDAINDIRVYDVTTTQTLSLSGLSAGPESNQTTTISVSSDRLTAFSLLSIVGSELRFSLNPNQVSTNDITVSIIVRDNGGIANGGIDSITRTFRLGIDPIPIINTDNTLLSLGGTARLSVSAKNVNSFNWINKTNNLQIGVGPSVNVRPSASTTYLLNVTNRWGYSALVSFTQNVIKDYKLLKPYNILTPNGDGVNDRWVIENIDVYGDNEVMIFDKAGRLLYKVINYRNEFNGTINGKYLAQDIYQYVIKFNDPKVKPILGYITIIR